MCLSGTIAIMVDGRNTSLCTTQRLVKNLNKNKTDRNRQKNYLKSNFCEPLFSIKFSTEVSFAIETLQPELNTSRSPMLLHEEHDSLKDSHHTMDYTQMVTYVEHAANTVWRLISTHQARNHINVPSRVVDVVFFEDYVTVPWESLTGSGAESSIHADYLMGKLS